MKFRTRFASLLIFMLLSALAGAAEPATSGVEGASRLLQQIERAEADIADLKKLTQVSSEALTAYLNACGPDTQACSDAIADAMSEDGWPEQSVRNFRSIVTESRALADAGLSESEFRSQIPTILRKYPVARADGEAFDTFKGIWLGGTVAAAGVSIGGFATGRNTLGIAMAGTSVAVLAAPIVFYVVCSIYHHCAR